MMTHGLLAEPVLWQSWILCSGFGGVAPTPVDSTNGVASISDTAIPTNNVRDLLFLTRTVSSTMRQAEVDQRLRTTEADAHPEPPRWPNDR